MIFLAILSYFQVSLLNNQILFVTSFSYFIKKGIIWVYMLGTYFRGLELELVPVALILSDYTKG